MVFLQPLFELIESKFGESINHFPLVELIFYSIDQTLFYFIFWLIGRGIVLGLKKKKKKPIKWRREVVLNLFIFYILLLIHLTVFRAENSINNVSIVMRPLSEINWIPFVETAKLTQGTTLFDYYYNLYGNIIWFIPMGFGAAYLMKRNHFVLRSLLIGIAVSVLIESLQFIFYTGVSDIDDVIFNTIGTIIGIGLFKISHWIYKKRQIGKPLEKE
ncbi:MAG: VanZ family protein [Carnobacterium inhibens]